MQERVAAAARARSRRHRRRGCASGSAPKSALVVPLLFRGHAVGALVALDREAGGTDSTRRTCRLLQAFAASAATAVATAQSVESERLQQQVEIGERERQRWAQELHDDALQGLAAIRISLATALQGEAAGPGAADRGGGGGDGRAPRGPDQRAQPADQRPAAGAAGAPRPGRRLGGAGRGVLRARWARGRDRDRDRRTTLTGEEERVVYRLVQEALNNVLKHASAAQRQLDLRAWSDHQVRIAVEDDGRGFDPELRRRRPRPDRDARADRIAGRRDRGPLRAGRAAPGSRPASRSAGLMPSARQLRSRLDHAVGDREADQLWTRSRSRASPAAWRG